jgi:hypothetical protein
MCAPQHRTIEVLTRGRPHGQSAGPDNRMERALPVSDVLAGDRGEAERRVVRRVGQGAEARLDRRHPAVPAQVRGEHGRPILGRDLLGDDLFDVRPPDQPATAGGPQVTRPFGLPAGRDKVPLAIVLEDDDRGGSPLSAGPARHRQLGDQLRVARGEPVSDVFEPPRRLAVMQLRHAHSATSRAGAVVVRREMLPVPPRR